MGVHMRRTRYRSACPGSPYLARGAVGERVRQVAAPRRRALTVLPGRRATRPGLSHTAIQWPATYSGRFRKRGVFPSHLAIAIRKVIAIAALGWHPKRGRWHPLGSDNDPADRAGPCSTFPGWHPPRLPVRCTVSRRRISRWTRKRAACRRLRWSRWSSRRGEHFTPQLRILTHCSP